MCANMTRLSFLKLIKRYTLFSNKDGPLVTLANMWQDDLLHMQLSYKGETVHLKQLKGFY